MKKLFSMLAATALASALVLPAQAVEATVVSALKVESYTYVEVSHDGKTEWVVVDLMDLQPGSRVSYEAGMVTDNFYSKFLNRTFAQVEFVSDFRILPTKK